MNFPNRSQPSKKYTARQSNADWFSQTGSSWSLHDQIWHWSQSHRRREYAVRQARNDGAGTSSICHLLYQAPVQSRPN
ncbi:hypothetical protein CJF30_00000431 [Rutstroemia sp. NJR-2017a BBW]|nr:hypothetical protein CJF30_00000431 [Rutstroemia sp. NJR-2017a BBW]